MTTEVPVFMFNGFLDSGKTTFIQSILENPEFSNGIPTLLVICEEGEEEYHPERFAKGKVTFYNVENEEDLEPYPLEKARKAAKESLMKELAPHFNRLASGRKIEGLSAYVTE